MSFYYTDQASWQFHNPVQLIFGSGCLEQLPQQLPEGKVLLVTTPGFNRRGVVDRISRLLNNRDLEVFDQVEPNPDLDYLEKHRDVLKKVKPEVLLALGGGSVLDTAKAYCFLLGQDREFSLKSHLEEKTPLPPASPLPWVAVPTTAGTGSEVTPFATLWDMEKEKKHSLAAPGIFASQALLDPQLTRDLPLETTVNSGLDALSHALEAYWNKNANPITMLYSREAVGLVLNNLYPLTREPENLLLRARMMRASLLGGLAISGARTALAHSISYPVTARFGMPHGLACSFTLPSLLQFNQKDDDGRLKALAKELGHETPENLKEALLELFEQVEVGDLVKKYLSSVEDILPLTSRMITPGRADNNLREAGAEDIEGILKELSGSI